jgi:AcrR family transcriptional regulator
MSTLQAEAAGGPYHHGDLKRAQIDAALDQLAYGGAGSIGLRELARRVGVSTAAPYRHFKSREALLAAVAAEGFARLEATLAAARDQVPQPERLAAMGRAYVRFALGSPALFRLMFSADIDKTAHADLRRAADRAFAPLTAAAAQESRVAAFETAVGAWALVHGLAQLLIEQQVLAEAPEDIEMLVRIITNRFVAGLRAT